MRTEVQKFSFSTLAKKQENIRKPQPRLFSLKKRSNMKKITK